MVTFLKTGSVGVDLDQQLTCSQCLFLPLFVSVEHVQTSLCLLAIELLYQQTGIRLVIRLNFVGIWAVVPKHVVE